MCGSKRTNTIAPLSREALGRHAPIRDRKTDFGAVSLREMIFFSSRRLLLDAIAHTKPSRVNPGSETGSASNAYGLTHTHRAPRHLGFPSCSRGNICEKCRARERIAIIVDRFTLQSDTNTVESRLCACFYFFEGKFVTQFSIISLAAHSKNSRNGKNI